MCDVVSALVVDIDQEFVPQVETPVQKKRRRCLKPPSSQLYRGSRVDLRKKVKGRRLSSRIVRKLGRFLWKSLKQVYHYILKFHLHRVVNEVRRIFTSIRSLRQMPNAVSRIYHLLSRQYHQRRVAAIGSTTMPLILQVMQALSLLYQAIRLLLSHG